MLVIGLQADELQQSAGFRTAFGRRAQPLQAHRLGDVDARRHARIERGERVLEDDLDTPAHQPLLALRRGEEIGAADPDMPLIGLDERENQARKGRFPAAALPHQTESLPPRERQIHLRHGLHARPPRAAPAEALHQAADLEQRLSHGPAPPGRGGRPPHGRRLRRGDADPPCGNGPQRQGSAERSGTQEADR